MTGHASERALFVYYKVDRQGEAALLSLVRDFQRRLRTEWPQLSCELMQRPAGSGEARGTWMEIYRTSEGLSAPMIDAIARLAQEMQLPAPRHSEVFAPILD